MQCRGFVSGNGLFLCGIPLLESAESVGFAVLFDRSELVGKFLFDVRVLVTLLANQSVVFLSRRRNALYQSMKQTALAFRSKQQRRRNSRVFHGFDFNPS